MRKKQFPVVIISTTFLVALSLLKFLCLPDRDRKSQTLGQSKEDDLEKVGLKMISFVPHSYCK